MREEKTALYTRKHPASDGGVNGQAQAMVKAAAEAGYEAAPRGSIVKAICGSSSKPSLARSWTITFLGRLSSFRRTDLSEWGARPNKTAPLLYLSSVVNLSSRCGAGDWMACRPWSPTGWWP